MDGERIVPEREKRMAEGETASASLKGWYAEMEDSGSSGPEVGVWSHSREELSCGMFGK